MKDRSNLAAVWFFLFLLFALFRVEHSRQQLEIDALRNTQQKLIDMVCYLEGHCAEPEWDSFHE